MYNTYVNFYKADIFVSYILAARESSSLFQFLNITYITLRSNGFLDDAWEYIKILFREHGVAFDQNQNMVHQSGFDFGEFLGMIKYKFASFNLIKNSKCFKLITKLASMFVSVGLCKASNLSFSLGGIELFSHHFLKRLSVTNCTLSDIFDLCCEATEFFINTGYLCFKTGSFRPLLFDNEESFRYANLHVSIVSSWDSIEKLDWCNSPFKDMVDFKEKATELIDYYKNVYCALVKVNTSEATLVQRKWNEIETKLHLAMKVAMCGKVRKAPFAMLIHGGSSVGKSGICQTLCSAAVIGQGGNPSPEYTVVKNPNEKFFSTYKYGTECIVLDDMCNTKPEFIQQSPLESIIEYVNNVASSPVMADLASKGKIPLEPKVVAVTTNVEDLLVRVYTNEPVSILRRFNIIMTVKVKKQFALNPDIDDSFTMIDPVKVQEEVDKMKINGKSDIDVIMPDCWDIYLYNICAGEPDCAGARASVKKNLILNPYRHNDNIFSLREVSDFVAHSSRVHSEQQSIVVSRILTTSSVMSDHYSTDYPHSSKFDPHLGDFNCSRFKDFVDKQYNRSIPVIRDIFVYLNCESYCNYSLLPVLSFFTTYILRAFTGINPFIYAYPIYVYLSNIRKHQTRYDLLRSQYYSFSLSHPKCVTTFYGLTSIFVTIITFRFMGKTILRHVSDHFKKSLEPHGNLNPLSAEELKKNSEEPNIFSTTYVHKVPLGDFHTSSAEHLLDLVSNNLCLIKFNVHFTNILFLSTNIAVIPKHFYDIMVKDSAEHFTLQLSPSQYDGNSLNFHSKNYIFDTAAFSHIRGTDLCITYITGGIPRKNLIKYIIDNHSRNSLPARMVVRNFNFDKQIYDAVLHRGYQDTGPSGCGFEGYSYKLLKGSTFAGMCIGVWVSDTKPSYICGLHLGGITNTPVGCAGCLTRSVLDNYIRSFVDSNPCFVKVGDEGTYDIHYGSRLPDGVDCNPTRELAPDNPVNFLPEDAEILCYGSVGETHKYRTKVVQHKLAPLLFSYLGEKIMHGPPNMNLPPKWYHFSKCMQKFTRPGIGPSLTTLTWAIRDYEIGVRSKLNSLSVFSIKHSPLSMKENINGIDGMRYVDSIKLNTSVGFPFRGTSSLYISGEPGSRYLNDKGVVFLDKMLEMEHQYLESKRCYPVFSAHLKDEPKSLGSDKVRVFFGAPNAFKLLIRKYYLPIVRYLSEIPLISECAVGINSHSDEWEQLYIHTSTFGKDRIIAGDYSGWDQQLPASVTQACLKILVNLARDMGYDEDSLTIMESMIPDITNPTVNFYGSLVMFMGGNPSGQNLTVYLNSLVNSVISRCAFYDLCPTRVRPYYRSHVSQITYGDDDMGSVVRTNNWFNSITKSHQLAQYGLTYTPPSKTGEHTAYMHIDTVDFLKRFSVYNEELQLHFGALNWSSILKSLSYGIPSNFVTSNELMGQVIDQALNELYYHGEDVYESKRFMFNSFIKDSDLQRFVSTNHKTFDDRTKDWCERYKYCENTIGYQGGDAGPHPRLSVQYGTNTVFQPGLFESNKSFNN